MAFQYLIYERRGPAAWVTLNRLDVLNSLNPGLIDELVSRQATPGEFHEFLLHLHGKV